MKAKTIYSKAGADAGVVVASGKAELGVNQWQVVMPVAGIENAARCRVIFRAPLYLLRRS